MSKIGSAAAFILGAAIGSGVTWYFIKDKYTKRSEQDILSAKEAFHNREEKLKAEIKELKGESEPKEGLSDDKENIVDFVKGRYSKCSSDKNDDKNDLYENTIAPYVISPDEFGELEGYTKISLSFYADGILADENGVIIDDIEEIVGDAIDHFGEYEDDSVFCRNDVKRCDYEILSDLRRYADVRKNLPPNM